MDSQGFSMGLDDNETIELTFSSQIGGTNQTGQGFFYSGQSGKMSDVYVDRGGEDVSADNTGIYTTYLYQKYNDKAPYSSEDG